MFDIPLEKSDSLTYSFGFIAEADTLCGELGVGVVCVCSGAGSNQGAAVPFRRRAAHSFCEWTAEAFCCDGGAI